MVWRFEEGGMVGAEALFSSHLPYLTGRGVRGLLGEAGGSAGGVDLMIFHFELSQPKTFLHPIYHLYLPSPYLLPIPPMRELFTVIVCLYCFM